MISYTDTTHLCTILTKKKKNKNNNKYTDLLVDERMMWSTVVQIVHGRHSGVVDAK